MILRHDDPLVKPLQALGEPIYLLDSNPTVERIARLIFEKTSELGFPVVEVRVWETPTSFATYRSDETETAPEAPEAAPRPPLERRRTHGTAADETGRLRSRRHPDRLPAPTSPRPPTGCCQSTAPGRCPSTTWPPWSATAPGS